MKLKTLVNAEQALRRLADCRTLTARQAFGVAKMIKACRDDLTAYHDARNDLLKKYGRQVAGDESRYTIGADNLRAYQAEMTELLETDTAVEIVPVEISGDTVGLSGDDVLALEAFITIGE